MKVAILAAGFMLALTGCPNGADSRQQELMIERGRRVQAERKADESEKGKETWKTVATGAAASAFVLLVIGAALGSMAKRDVHL